MYASFFGLKHEPFSIAPDPRYLFMSERHREALAHLLYGINGGGGFVLLSGEIGAGKTTVCRCFLEQIPKRCNVAYIFNPKLTVPELLQSVCEEFGIARPKAANGPATVKDYLDPLNEFLLRTHAVGQNNILIIDEAQMLSAEVLEQLRLLTNLETNERKLLQIVLIGQPELRDMLARPELEQLAQRVIARYHLGALSESETGQYIRHRLAVAGMTTAMPFGTDAISRLHRLSRGVPRRINLLCDRALLGAYASGKGHVDRGIVDTAALEVFGKRVNGPKRKSRRPRGDAWMPGLLAGAAVAGVVALLISAVLRDTRYASPGDRRLAAAASAPAASAPVQPASAASAVAASSAASAAPAAASAPLYLSAADLESRFKSLIRDETAAWRALAPAWNLDPGNADPCAAAARQQVQCYRNGSTDLALIRQLDRPGILTLYDANAGPVYALLTGLSGQSATLRIGDVSHSVSLLSLASLWRGEFATYWRAPPGYTGGVIDAGSGAPATWLNERLAKLRDPSQPAPAPTTNAAWQARIAEFQLSQGLKTDGLVGPTTLMQLSRATGVDEPRLRSTPATP